MARKERNDVDYFPHSVRHGKKMFYIRSIYGNDGYAVWFMLLEHLGKASYHYLDLSDDVEIMYLSSELQVSDTLLKDIINSLVTFGEFDKDLWEENQILYNDKFVENVSDAYKKRNNDCINKEDLIILLESKGTRKPSKSNPKPPKSNPKPLKGSSEVPDNPQSKVKYSKEYKSIVDSDKLFCFEDWLNYRQEIKKPIKTESTMKSLVNRFNKEPLDKCISVVRNSIENNYQGLFWDNYKLAANKNDNKPQRPTF